MATEESKRDCSTVVTRERFTQFGNPPKKKELMMVFHVSLGFNLDVIAKAFSECYSCFDATPGCVWGGIK